MLDARLHPRSDQHPAQAGGPEGQRQKEVAGGAIERADHAYTWCRRRSATTLAFGQLNEWRWERRQAVNVVMPGHNVRDIGPSSSLRAVVPAIPPYLKPAGRLERYHILWEAEWEPVAPKDPILLQHIAGDAWAVLAQWDLTEVERMVLAGRFTG